MKLLPSTAESAIIKPKTSVISASKFVPSSSNKKVEGQEKTVVIKEKLTTIAGLLEGTLASKKKEETDKKKKEQQERRGTREAKLEKKPKTKGKLELPNIPGMSFLDRIKQFIMNVLGGYLLYKLVEFAPLLTPILTGIMHVGEWLIDFGGKILNGLVTFIDWGYQAYDWTRGQVKNIFGEEGAKKFDDFSGLINKLLNGVLIGAMIGIKIAQGARKAALKDSLRSNTGRAAKRGISRVDQSGGINYRRGRVKGETFSSGSKLADARINRLEKSGRLTFDGKSATDMGFQQRKGQTDVIKRYADKFGRKKAIARFGSDTVNSLGGRYGRSKITNLGRAALVKGLGKGGVKTAAKILKPIVKNIPLIGGIMEFVLSMVSGDPVGKAAFRGIGTGFGTWLGGAIGTIPVLLPFGGPIIGSILGGAAGAELGGLLYDTIFKDKEPPSQPAENSSNDVDVLAEQDANQAQEFVEKYYGTEEQAQPVDIQGRQEGGQIKPLDIPKKQKLNPNYAKGIQQVSKVKPDDDKSNFSGSAKAFNQIDYFGPILATATKILAGDDPSQSDYKSIGAGFSNLLVKGFQDGKLKNNLAIAYNDGGIVSANTLQDGPLASANLSRWVGDTFKGLFAKNKPNIEKTIKETGDTKTTKKTPKTLEGMLKQAIESMSGMSPEPDGGGSTAGPGSIATVRDSATGVPMTSAGQASGAVQSDGELVSSMGFSAEDWNLFRNTVAQIESGGTYDIAGGSGDHYDGRYQLGAAAKTDGARYAGVVDPGHGPGAREAFRKDAELQEKLFAGFTKANHSYLMGVPEYKDSTPQRKLQILGYAHNQGMGGAANWMKTGVVGADGFGTKGTKYTDSIAAEFRKKSQKMQFGGEVNGQEGIDKVPAMLTSGEFVMDKDSTMAIQTAFPGFLSAVNKAEGQKAVEILMNYASYNDPTAGEIIVIDRKEVIAQAPMESASSTVPAMPSRPAINFKEILNFVG